MISDEVELWYSYEVRIGRSQFSENFDGKDDSPWVDPNEESVDFENFH